MNQKRQRKTDRRTIYTRTVIKDALLELLTNTDYNEITITSLCRQAEIGRGTFYLHYDNIGQATEEVLKDALQQIRDMLVQVGFEPADDKECSYPLCLFLREQKKYQPLFFSDTLRSHVIDSIYASGKEHFLRNMQMQVKASEDILLSLFFFQLNGCMALAKRYVDISDDEWEKIQCSVDRFLKGGLSSL